MFVFVVKVALDDVINTTNVPSLEYTNILYLVTFLIYQNT